MLDEENGRRSADEDCEISVTQQAEAAEIVALQRIWRD
jgi:hypothetical protein